MRGNTPHSLADFVDDVHFTVDLGAGMTAVAGVGAPDGTAVRVRQKDDNTKDVRVWLVRLDPRGVFTAELVSPLAPSR
ncbi:hypothetical protein [Nakamurella endophytica]|uniref:hypothetical protein n=1 Tax=Nakamurella endophytica TaxID=1748367 RepID=UPI0016663745|nr:hypothetical protein [Nakamurella endophytica]